jgi:Protein of unknown function (DUF3179)
MHKLSKPKMLKIGFFFKPFVVPFQGSSLAQIDLHPDEELIVIERKGEYRALLAREMAYHHVAQGELAGEPYLVTF